MAPCAPLPRIPTPVQETIVVNDTFSDALAFMALDPETSFSPEHAKQKVLRKWILYLHDDILDSVKELNDRRLPLRYPGPSDPVKEARDAMIHVEKLLSSGVIYSLPLITPEREAPTNPTARYNFMYHLMGRQPAFMKDMLFTSFMLSRGMTMYKRRTPEGKPKHKTEGTLKMIIELAGKVKHAAQKIELEREHQLLRLCSLVVDEAKKLNVEIRPDSPHAIRCALEQAKVVGAMKTDVMFGFMDSYRIRTRRVETLPEAARKLLTMDVARDLKEDIKVHCDLDVQILV